MAITTDIGFKNRLAFPTGVKVSVTVSGALYLAYSFLQFIFISSSFSRILHYCYIFFKLSLYVCQIDFDVDFDAVFVIRLS